MPSSTRGFGKACGRSSSSCWNCVLQQRHRTCRAADQQSCRAADQQTCRPADQLLQQLRWIEFMHVRLHSFLSEVMDDRVEMLILPSCMVSRGLACFRKHLYSRICSGVNLHQITRRHMKADCHTSQHKVVFSSAVSFISHQINAFIT